MKNYIKFAVISFVLGALLACSKNDANKVTVLLDWTINTNHTGLFVAQELGYFTDAGLKVDILPATADGVAADVVAAGRAQFTFMDQNDLTSAIDNNLPLLGLATIYPNNHSAFVSLANSGISRPRDFAGRRYMGWGGALEEKIIKTLIALDGGDPNLLEIVPTLGMSDISSLTAGFADIIWYYEGWDGVMAKLLGVNLNKVP
jgi:ABC-type nitrate/sulfonate/bicarbonate transport system substrate-binding protein